MPTELKCVQEPLPRVLARFKRVPRRWLPSPGAQQIIPLTKHFYRRDAQPYSALGRRGVTTTQRQNSVATLIDDHATPTAHLQTKIDDHATPIDHLHILVC